MFKSASRFQQHAARSKAGIYKPGKKAKAGAKLRNAPKSVIKSVSKRAIRDTGSRLLAEVQDEIRSREAQALISAFLVQLRAVEAKGVGMTSYERNLLLGRWRSVLKRPTQELPPLWRSKAREIRPLISALERLEIDERQGLATRIPRKRSAKCPYCGHPVKEPNLERHISQRCSSAPADVIGGRPSERYRHGGIGASNAVGARNREHA